MGKGKRSYPIVEDFDDVKGLELEGPLGTATSYGSSIWGKDKIMEKVKEEIQKKVQEDDRFSEGEYLLLIKKEELLSPGRPSHLSGAYHPLSGAYARSLHDNYVYTMECDVYRIKRGK